MSFNMRNHSVNTGAAALLEQQAVASLVAPGGDSSTSPPRKLVDAIIFQATNKPAPEVRAQPILFRTDANSRAASGN